jgi:MoaA/NifB/PqqE/SkfB family radical SAM enzyme
MVYQLPMRVTVNATQSNMDELDELLNKYAKQHMIEWNLERFKISHRRLYAMFRAVYNEATTDNAKDFEIDALKRQIKLLEHEKTNSQK